MAQADGAPQPVEGPPPPLHVRAPFWEAARNPNARRADTLVRQGRAQLYPALGLGLLLGTDVSSQRRASLENAMARFERARSLAPTHPEALYLSGKALSLWERRTPQGRLERRTDEAIARLEELRRVDPLYEAEDVAFELGVLYTRKGDFGRAAEAYERALALRIDDGSRSVLLGNLAEVTMMGENLEHALELYQRAVNESAGADERVLALWGMAVALDRLGERGEALERAKQALRDDQRPMGALKQSSVFFVPAYEAHYYDGLGFLAMAEVEAGEHAQAEHVARNAARALDHGAAGGPLLALKQVLASLEDEGHRALVASLYPLVDRALRKAPKAHKRDKPRAEEKPKEARELKVILLTLQSLRAFARYLDKGGEQGPWASEARAHVAELSRWFAPARSHVLLRR